MAFPVIKYCLATREDVTLDSEDAEVIGDDAVGPVDICLDAADVGETSFLEDEASAKSSGKFKARKTSTISS